MDSIVQAAATPRPCPQTGRWQGRAALAGASLAFVLGAAHFFRSGQQGLSCVCLVWAGLLWRPVAWLRRSAAVFLLGLGVEWGMTTLALARWRLQLGQDWLRMVCILGAVAALTLLAAAALRSRACRRDEAPGPRAQALACLLVSALLLLLDGLRPELLLLHRLMPGWGAVQALPAGLWAGLVYGWLADRRRAPLWRRRIWLLFSCVFFGQLLAGLFLHSLFLLQGVPHLSGFRQHMVTILSYFSWSNALPKVIFSLTVLEKIWQAWAKYATVPLT